VDGIKPLRHTKDTAAGEHVTKTTMSVAVNAARGFFSYISVQRFCCQPISAQNSRSLRVWPSSWQRSQQQDHYVITITITTQTDRQTDRQTETKCMLCWSSPVTTHAPVTKEHNHCGNNAEKVNNKQMEKTGGTTD